MTSNALQDADRDCALLSGSALQSGTLSVTIKDREGTFVRVNEQFAMLIGAEPAQLVGTTDEQLFPRDVVTAVRAHDAAALESAQVTICDEPVVDRVGRRVLTTCRFALRDAGGVAWGVCRVSGAAGQQVTVREEADRLHALASEATAEVLAEAVQRATLERTDPRERLTALEQDYEALGARLAQLQPDVEHAQTQLRETVGLIRALVGLFGADRELVGVLQSAVTPLGQRLGFDAVAAWTAGRPGLPLQVAGVWSAPDAQIGGFERSTWLASVLPGSGATAEVFADGEAAWIGDTDATEDDARMRDAATAELRSAGLVPIIGHGETLGVIEAFSAQSFAADDPRLEALELAGLLLGQFGAVAAVSARPRWRV